MCSTHKFECVFSWKNLCFFGQKILKCSGNERILCSKMHNMSSDGQLTVNYFAHFVSSATSVVMSSCRNNKPVQWYFIMLVGKNRKIQY